MVSECSGRLSGLFFRMLCLAFILHFQCSVFTCPAQTATYPVQVSTNLIPPYSLYLSDYAQGAREHVSVTLINRDANRPGLNVRLRLTVRGQGFTIQTLPQAVFAPITIDPHIPYRLSQQELAPYFEPSALSSQGVGMQSYRGEGRLPEGMLQFCFEVVEYSTGRLISQQGCGAAWLAVQKPPQLSQPFNKENVTLRDPLNLLFQWTPRHSGLAGIEYELIVKQLFDSGGNGVFTDTGWTYMPGMFNYAKYKLKFTWEGEKDKEGEKEVLITDHNIAEAVQNLKISAARVKQYLTGNQVNESDKDDYKNVLIRLYQLGKMSKPGVYDIIFMPYRLGLMVLPSRTEARVLSVLLQIILRLLTNWVIISGCLILERNWGFVEMMTRKQDVRQMLNQIILWDTIDTAVTHFGIGNQK
jgi:hypothetical protein